MVTNDSGTAPDTAKFHFTMKAEDKTFPMPVGQVLGAARDKIEESPVGQVLGAVRGATRTGDNSFMMISALCFFAAIAVLTGWIMTFLKRRMS